MMLQTCVILAGGLGSRLSGVLAGRPKCLAPIGSRTFLELQIESLASRGIDRFVLSLGHQADQVLAVTEILQARFTIDPVVEPSRLGTGGGVLFTLDHCALEEALVVNGDTWLDGPLDAMFEPLRGSEQLRMAAVAVPDRGRFGGLELQGAKVVGFVEKGSNTPGLINAGLYRVHRRAFEGWHMKSAFSLEADVMPHLMDFAGLTAITIDGSFIDIGVPEDYYRFCNEHALA